ncbi:hypothetical protein B0H65DRAFT_1893 [Neurospora tetraspora]|uniref:HMG box domain-containing protein n=1 Tax=Neurospora tetraspora TaxID=94610 RepID=A0AAE0JM46_9PEZI|nr:hypothetical protein B0H65DRAFT_1893 [Neurospora tetraspora]
MFSQIALATARQLRAGTTLVVRTAAAASTSLTTRSAAPSFLRRSGLVFQQRGYALTRSKKTAAESHDTAATATKTNKTRSTAAKSKKSAAKGATSAAAKTKTPRAKKEAAPKKPKKSKAAKTKAPLTEEQKLKLKIRLYKQRALFKEDPKTHRATGWAVFVREHIKDVIKEGDALEERRTYFAKLAPQWKELSAAEKDRYHAKADKAHQDGLAARAAWVLTKTPMEIETANYARHALKRLGVTPIVHLIPDDRGPKRQRTAFVFFCMSRQKDGAFVGKSAAEVSKALAKEWKSMDDAAKQPYIDNAEVDRERYHSERAATTAAYAAA